jgi:TPP-dependent pyruvate/acetoin dehydrogenase alpha subunit
MLVTSLTFVTLACKTPHEEGVTSSYRSQWTYVAADTKTTTNAAKTVMERDGLTDIKVSSTDMDGTATARQSDGKQVSVTIKKVDNGSQVSVTIGTVGDPAVGAGLAKKIKNEAEAK